MPSVAVVILNWNGKEYLKQFLPSVVAYTPEAKIIVADNGSTDDTLSFLEANFPTIEIIRLHHNYGFCEGYNKALSQLNTDFFVLLNSDVEVTKGWLAPMISLLEANKNIAACQPKILSHSEPTHFEYAGAAGGFIDQWGFAFCRGRIFSTLEQDLCQYDDNVEIFWATGACLLIRAEVYQKMKGLDADFFAHMEEIDLCWRIINQGKKIYYCGKSTVYHVGGGTLNKTNPQKTFLNFRNNLFLLHKNLPQQLLLKTIFIRLLFDGLASVHMLCEWKLVHIWAVVRAHWAYFNSIMLLNEKRKVVSKDIPYKLPYIIYKRSIVLEYFLRKRKVFGKFINL